MKTSKAHARIFERECEYWCDYFGLKNWERWYEHKELVDAVAEAAANPETRLSVLRVNIDFKKYNKSDGMWELYKSAFHEVCEVMLSKISTLAQVGCSQKMVNEEIHNIIHTLENTIWIEYAKKKGLKNEIQDVDKD